MSADLSVESISALQASRVRQQIDVSVLQKANDAGKQQGEAIVSLLESVKESAGGGRKEAST